MTRSRGKRLNEADQLSCRAERLCIECVLTAGGEGPVLGPFQAAPLPIEGRRRSSTTEATMSPSPRWSFALVVGLTTAVLIPTPHRPPHRIADNAIAPNDNRKPAGKLAGNVLTIALEAKPGTFYPESN